MFLFTLKSKYCIHFIFMLFLYHPYVTRMYSFVLCMLLIRHPHVTRMYSLSSICHSHVIHMSLVCALMYSYVLVCHSYVTRMSFVCLSYVLVRHPYLTRMYSYVIRMSLVCTRMSLVCYSDVHLCHCSCVTRMWFYTVKLIWSNLLNEINLIILIKFRFCHIIDYLFLE